MFENFIWRQIIFFSVSFVVNYEMLRTAVYLEDLSSNIGYWTSHYTKIINYFQS